MSGGEHRAERTKRLDAEETVARLVECPRVDPSPLVQRSDSASDLEGARDRCGARLGHLAASQVVVLPQLDDRIDEPGDQAISDPKPLRTEDPCGE